MAHAYLVMNSASVLQKSKSNFALAFVGLAKPQRKALEAVYAYCRIVDDIADESETIEQAHAGLLEWRNAFSHWPDFSLGLPTQVAKDLSWAVQHFPIHQSDLMWILEGVEGDLIRTRYETMEELLKYCDAVASAVGFCCTSILGVDHTQASEYAFATGRALQLTNILRDIASDALRDRVYIPRKFLAQFGLTDQDLLQSRYDESFLNMVESLSKKIQEYYDLSEMAGKSLPMEKIWPTEVMRKTYYSIFQKIKENKYDVYSGKVKISKAKKVWIALSQSRS